MRRGLKVLAIIGGVVAGTVVIAHGAFLASMLLRRRAEQSAAANPQQGVLHVGPSSEHLDLIKLTEKYGWQNGENDVRFAYNNDRPVLVFTTFGNERVTIEFAPDGNGFVITSPEFAIDPTAGLNPTYDSYVESRDNI